MGFDTLEYELVGFVIIARPVIDIVFTVTFGEEVGIALVVAALHVVVTSAANEGVMAISTVELVVTRTTVQRIVTVIAFEGVVTGAAVEDVVPTVTVQDIVTVFTRKIVGTLIAAQAVIAVAADAVPQDFQVLFAEDVSVLGESAVLSRFGGKLHKLLGQRCHCGVFAVGIAFSQQFTKVGEGFAGVFLVNFGEECGYIAVIRNKLTIIIFNVSNSGKIRTKTSLKEQTVIKTVGETIIGIVDGINDVLRLFFIGVIKVLAFGSGEGVQNSDSAV